VIVTGGFVAFMAAVVPLYVHFSLPEGWSRFCLVLLSSTAGMAASTYYIALDRQRRQRALSFIVSKIKK
jgi:hypothetical protein